MIKLKIKQTLWSEDKRVQEAYERGCADQAEEDAEQIKAWLIRTGQIMPWLAPEVELIEESKEQEDE